MGAAPPLHMTGPSPGCCCSNCTQTGRRRSRQKLQLAKVTPHPRLASSLGCWDIAVRAQIAACQWTSWLYLVFQDTWRLTTPPGFAARTWTSHHLCRKIGTSGQEKSQKTCKIFQYSTQFWSHGTSRSINVEKWFEVWTGNKVEDFTGLNGYSNRFDQIPSKATVLTTATATVLAN